MKGKRGMRRRERLKSYLNNSNRFLNRLGPRTSKNKTNLNAMNARSAYATLNLRHKFSNLNATRTTSSTGIVSGNSLTRRDKTSATPSVLSVNKRSNF